MLGSVSGLLIHSVGPFDSLVNFEAERLSCEVFIKVPVVGVDYCDHFAFVGCDVDVCDILDPPGVLFAPW